VRAAVPPQLTEGRVGAKPGEYRFVPSEKELKEASIYARELLKLSQSMATLTREEEALAFALRREEAYTAELERINALLRTRKRSLAHDRAFAREKRAETQEALAYALRDQGRLEEAKKYASPAQKRRLSEGQRAIRRPDGQRCRCAPPRVRMVGPNGVEQELELPSTVILKRIFSPERLAQERRAGRRKNQRRVDEGWLYLWQCVGCGFLNATPQPPEELREFEQMRAMVARDPKAALKNGPQDVRLLAVEVPRV
jgi:hypothetical protein